MTLEVRRDMLVVRMGGSQGGVFGMRLAVIPTELLPTAPDFVSVGLNGGRQPVGQNALKEHQAEFLVEMKLARNAGQRGTAPHQGDCRVADGWELFRQRVKEIGVSI
jgi:hypothetical protein